MTDIPDALKHNPTISTWLRFGKDKVTVCTGKVELGQGITTALAMIAAEELDVPLHQVAVQTGRTDDGPREFPTVGSMSVEGSGSAIRQVSAEARYHLVLRACERFGLPFENMIVEAGVVTHKFGNERASFAELTAGAPLDIEVTGEIKPKSPAHYSVVGHAASRMDLVRKINGEPAYIQDFKPPGLKHARVIRPPHYEQTLLAVDPKKATRIPGFFRLVHDGSFLAVVADTDTAAETAANLVQTTWSPQPVIPSDTQAFLRRSVSHSLLVEDGVPTDSTIPVEPDVDLFKASYFKPYHLHGSLAPSAAMAVWNNQALEVHCHSQGPALIRHSLAQALNLESSQVTVIHRENAGCYGHNGADDAAMDAALIAMKCEGVPVLLKWQRSDEHLHEPFSPAMVVDMAASVTDGHINYWQADVFSQTHSNRPFPNGEDSTTLLATMQKNDPLPKRIPKPGYAAHGGVHRNADPLYEFGDKRITKNLVDSTLIRTSSTRGLGAFANVFAIESFMDELALRSGIDPLEFRLAHLADVRARNVLKTMSTALNRYKPEQCPGEVTGHGLAFAQYKNSKCYAAVGVIVRIDEETLEISLEHAVISADAGLIIDRDGLCNQLEGGFIQAASWALVESVSITQSGSESRDWESYPILRFDQIPTVEVHLIEDKEAPSLGAGEATTGPTPAAIANAICNATGVRLRNIPLTKDALKQAALNASE